jgi:hypothetical protein
MIGPACRGQFITALLIKMMQSLAFLPANLIVRPVTDQHLAFRSRLFFFCRLPVGNVLYIVRALL